MTETDDLLDATLDDLADLPSFKPFPIGIHKVLATWELKEITNHGLTPELSFKYVECLEQADQQAEPAEEGDTANVLFFLDNDIGQGKFKEAIAAFADFAGTRINRQIIEACTDVECVIACSITQDKTDKDKLYMDLKEINVV